MLSFTSRRCCAVRTAQLPSRFFALVARKQLNTEELQSLVDEARHSPRVRKAPPCSRLGDEALATSNEPDYPTILRCKVRQLVYNAQRRSRDKGVHFDLDLDFLLDLLLEQKGMCAYSGVDLELVGPRAA